MADSFPLGRKELFAAIAGLVLIAGCAALHPRSGLVLPTEIEQRRLGELAFADVRRKEPPTGNARWKRLLERAGQRIADAAHAGDWAWQFSVVESHEAGGACFPGGKVVIETGLLLAAGTEATLAGIVAHLCVHALRGDLAQRIALAMGSQIGAGGLDGILEGGESEDHRMLMGALGWSSGGEPGFAFSEAQELEADRSGLSLTARAGYDPRGTVFFWQRAGGDSRFAESPLSAHPRSPARVTAWTEALARAQAEYRRSPQYGAGEKL
jgi:predicted Zn-dependent protease